MSVAECQYRVSAAEFAEWLALWEIEAEEQTRHEPTADEFEARMNAMMVAANAVPKK
jgi:hypothetical protein